MGVLTPFFNLFKPAKTDAQRVAKLNDNFDIIDAEMHRPPLTVNDVEPDSETRNIYLETVPLADNLTSEDAQLANGTFVERATGGEASIADGEAALVTLKGNMVKTGYVAESITMTVTPATREEGETPITATLDRDDFVAAASASGTYTFTYTTSWSVDPEDYGITVTGTPISGDVISVVYVKEDRGTLTPATPTSFNSTGWNLYNNTTGYAKVIKYSDTYEFMVGGTYSLLEFATTVTGTRTGLTVVDGYFSIPSDGYVFVTGGDATTYILMTWSDWVIDGYEGDFQTYTVSTIDLSEAMLAFPYGLLAVGNVRDEINLNTQLAISRIERMAYTAENLAAVIASGVDYDVDTNYIYAVRAAAQLTAISVDGTYAANDHGIEFFTGTSIPVVTDILYGQNLKDKLRRDVVTISSQSLSASQKAQVQSNLGLVPTQATDITAAGYVADARAIKSLNDQIGTLNSKFSKQTATTGVNITANYSVNDSAAIAVPTGYSLVSMCPRFIASDVIITPIGMDNGRLYYRLVNTGGTNYGIKNVYIDALFMME